jgi:hypothetical protein
MVLEGVKTADALCYNIIWLLQQSIPNVFHNPLFETHLHISSCLLSLC